MIPKLPPLLPTGPIDWGWANVSKDNVLREILNGPATRINQDSYEHACSQLQVSETDRDWKGFEDWNREQFKAYMDTFVSLGQEVWFNKKGLKVVLSHLKQPSPIAEWDDFRKWFNKHAYNTLSPVDKPFWPCVDGFGSLTMALSLDPEEWREPARSLDVTIARIYGWASKVESGKCTPEKLTQALKTSEQKPFTNGGNCYPIQRFLGRYTILSLGRFEGHRYFLRTMYFDDDDNHKEPQYDLASYAKEADWLAGESLDDLGQFRKPFFVVTRDSQTIFVGMQIGSLERTTNSDDIYPRTKLGIPVVLRISPENACSGGIYLVNPNIEARRSNLDRYAPDSDHSDALFDLGLDGCAWACIAEAVDDLGDELRITNKEPISLPYTLSRVVKVEETLTRPSAPK